MSSEIPNLIARWREQATTYDARERHASGNRQHVIAAQQGGLATAFRCCANELAALLTYQQTIELRANAKRSKPGADHE